MSGTIRLLALICLTHLTSAIAAAAPAPVDAAGYDPRCGIDVRAEGPTLRATWAAGETKLSVAFDMSGESPLVQSLSVAEGGRDTAELARDVRPQFLITTGSRKRNAVDRFVFFDKPASRPTQKHPARLELKSVRVSSEGKRATIAVSQLSAGPFSGELVFHLYAGSPLVRIEAVMSPGEQPDLAYIYDAVLAGDFRSIAWQGLDGQLDRAAPAGEMTPVAVKGRTILAESPAGSIAVFPPPHAFFFPRDRTDNLRFAQFGKDGFGLRQDPDGGGAFVPWFDAPPGRPQHMGMFLLLSGLPADRTIERISRYTHGDAFKPMEGYQTFTSHFHSRLTVAAMAGKDSVAAEFARVMKGMNVNIVHVAEFHGDGHPEDAGPLRLPELKAMFDLCRGHSDDRLLVIPGEEGNRYLAHPWPPAKGIHPGHWMYLFPEPVYLTFTRAAGQPFAERIEPYGTVYHVGDRDDMARLLRERHGLAWTTHPRIKASYATPDAFKDQAFFKDDTWLGAAWKAMPADLSEERLGRRALDVLDDMNNWGPPRKLLPGEVDVFEIDSSHELYGHMNVNYLRLPKLPSYDDWSEVLRVLRSGDFFVTTGEVLIHSFDVKDGQASADLEWTFPLRHAEVIWGDGARVMRKRLTLPDTTEFGRRRFTWPVELTGARWYRLEAWDVAGDGAFTQPKWIQ
jgi:hypothetical protein